MARASLFARLAPGGTTASNELDQVRASVLRNLQRLLGTRLGAAAAVPDLGMPAPRSVIETWPACGPQLQRTLLAGIQRFEPRLRGVRIVPLVDGDGPGFRLTADLLSGPGPQAYSATIRLTAAGHLACTP
jgi:type VI secretion system protein